MAIKVPSQNAQPAGAKFPPNIRISPINGLDIGSHLHFAGALCGSSALRNAFTFFVSLRTARSDCDINTECVQRHTHSNGNVARLTTSNGWYDSAVWQFPI